ncbi:MAG: extracellular solute-binding protein family 1, partial [Paenibacillaceae bacterium]|nr:extracellular solute-binding protein family 1 [Paenibacillaceae bacterium]
IFDKFGVAYPKDGLTWDQTIELARKLTRVDGEVQYKGLSASWTGQGVRDFASGFALPYIDPKTMKATVNTDGWKKALTILKEINDIPGNLGGDVRQLFHKDKILAMMVSANPRIGELEELFKKGEGVNYDFAAPPYFPELPGKTQETDTRFIAVSGTSKNRDLAFQVVQEIVSDANAVEFTRRAFPPVLKNADLKKQFGAELETLKGKHIEAFFKSTPIVSPIRTIYVNNADRAVQTEFTKVLKGEEDINTALRNADEAINKIVEAGEK